MESFATTAFTIVFHATRPVLTSQNVLSLVDADTSVQNKSVESEVMPTIWILLNLMDYKKTKVALSIVLRQKSPGMIENMILQTLEERIH